jgi:hypothetical protein
VILPVLSGIPSDPTGLPQLAAPLPQPQPDAGYIEVTCDRCGRDCWLGPKQAAARARLGIDVHCYFCLYDDLARGARPRITEAP